MTIKVHTDTQSPGSTTFTFNVGAISDGNILLACVSKHGSETISWPAGWTELHDVYSSTLVRTAIAWKLASSEGSSYAITSSGSQEWAGVIYEVPGINTTAPVTQSNCLQSDGLTPISPQISCLVGDLIIAGFGSGNTTLGLDGSLSEDASLISTATSAGARLIAGHLTAAGTTAGTYTHATTSSSARAVAFTIALTPAGESALAPVINNTGTHAQSFGNGDTSVDIDGSAFFDARGETVTGYSITTGIAYVGEGTPGSTGLELNTSTGHITGTIASDGSDASPNTVGLTITTDGGSIEEQFNINIYPKVTIASGQPVKLQNCTTIPTITSTATTYYKIFNGSNYETAQEVQAGSGESLASGEWSMTVKDADVVRAEAGFVSFYDPTGGFSLLIPVTFT